MTTPTPTTPAPVKPATLRRAAIVKPETPGRRLRHALLVTETNLRDLFTLLAVDGSLVTVSLHLPGEILKTQVFDDIAAIDARRVTRIDLESDHGWVRFYGDCDEPDFDYSVKATISPSHHSIEHAWRENAPTVIVWTQNSDLRKTLVEAVGRTKAWYSWLALRDAYFVFIGLLVSTSLVIFLVSYVNNGMRSSWPEERDARWGLVLTVAASVFAQALLFYPFKAIYQFMFPSYLWAFGAHSQSAARKFARWFFLVIVTALIGRVVSRLVGL